MRIEDEFGSWAHLVIDELIGVLCLKPRACSPDRNNTSIHLFTKIGHEPIYYHLTALI